MQIGESELHTGFFPDSILFDKMNAEYERKDLDGKNIWDSIPQFCNAYKFNEDGIAQEIQEAANAEIRELRVRAERLQNENNRLEDENENLRTELSGLMKRVDELSDEVGELPEQGVPKRIMMLATMMQALIAAAMDDNKADTILHQVWAYQYLLDELHEELKDK